MRTRLPMLISAVARKIDHLGSVAHGVEAGEEFGMQPVAAVRSEVVK